MARDCARDAMMPPKMEWVALLLLLSAVSFTHQEDFSCNQGLTRKGDPKESAAIIPRGDIIVRVGGPPVDVFCRFNSSFVRAEQVFFTTKEGPVDYQIHNSSTIRTEISSAEPQKYPLYCKLNRTKRHDKNLCSETVMIGYEPMNIENLTCIVKNNEDVNCTWAIPFNPVKTYYNLPTYVTKGFNETNCPESNSLRTYCFWGNGVRMQLRDSFQLRIYAKNPFGQKNFTHVINTHAFIVPAKVLAQVRLVEPVRARVEWNLTYPMDVLSSGVCHSVEFRLSDEAKWHNVTSFYHHNSHKTLHVKRTFSLEMDLPYANALYQFRVRIRSGYGGCNNTLWSSFDILSLRSDSIVPQVAPVTSISSFETMEVLESRDIYINFKDVDKLDHAGDHFHYVVKVFGADGKQIDVEPSEVTDAYFQFKSMNYSAYRFQIFPANEKGTGSVYSEVLVPRSDCLPKKTEMFSVITNTTGKKTFNLYWVPSKGANELCLGANPTIDSYTIFWCKKTNGDRCRTKLSWRKKSSRDLHKMSVGDVRGDLYNMTIPASLPGEIRTFGVAANSGRYSSGVRWVSCIVYDNESPNAPDTVLSYNPDKQTSVSVKWDLKCKTISAVHLGFNVSFCKSNFPDFGHCSAPVENEVIESPAVREVSIDDLEPGVSYIFSVAVLSLIGEGQQSVPKMMKLAEGIPSGPPTDTRVEFVSNTSVNLSWDPPAPGFRKGVITKYQVSTTPFTRPFLYFPANEEKKVFALLTRLRPFTDYHIRVSACTEQGCAQMVSANVTARTKAAMPSKVKDFEIDVSNWRLSWDRKRCDSANCSYEIQIINNGTQLEPLFIEGLSKLVQLRDLGLECNRTEMEFKIREIGVDETGRRLVGQWMSVLKDADDCPAGGLPWWALLIIVTVGFFLAIILFIVGRFGYGNIRTTIKDCYQNINLPKGIQAAAESGKEIHRKEFPPELMIMGRTSEPSLLLLHPDNSPVNICGPRSDTANKLSRASVSSEEVHLIDAIEGERQRSLLGSSDHSSAQDSALMSDSPSMGDTETDALAPQLGFGDNHETMLRLRSPVPAYVQEGTLLEKLCEGYVTAQSVPSLPHLYKEQSPPSAPTQLSGWQKARRASTGYITVADTEAKGPPLPSYSRHSFSPAPKAPPSPPTAGYVSAAEALKRPPSLPILMSGEAMPPLGAYCKVASRDAAPGYVSAGPVEGPTVAKSPYVSYGEAALMSSSRPDPPYVELSDAGRWAMPISRAPPERNTVGARVGPLPRPKTTEATMGHRKTSPSLSKQSSGYVSQETIGDAVLMSPKRLLSQAPGPHSVLMSPSHQASMV